MLFVSGLFLASLLGTPISNGIAWWLWSRRNAEVSSQWRAMILFIGLLSVSANTAIHYIWLPATGHLFMRGTPDWKLKEIAGYVSIPLVLVALVGAIFGKGSSRIPLAICAVLGFLLGLPVGVL